MGINSPDSRGEETNWSIPAKGRLHDQSVIDDMGKIGRINDKGESHKAKKTEWKNHAALLPSPPPQTKHYTLYSRVRSPCSFQLSARMLDTIEIRGLCFS